MKTSTTVTNEHQKYILSQLKTRQYARFKEIQPPKISSNSFSYHLKELQKGGWIVKSDTGYGLGPAGLAYAERDTESRAVRMQPNIVLMFVVQDGYGNILLHRKSEQPHINQWELPFANASVADSTVREAARWASKKLFHHVPETLRHAGDCYIRLHKGKVALSSTLAHVIRFSIDDYTPLEGYEWIDPLHVEAVPHAPGLEQIMTRTFFNDDFFFEEYTVQLAVQGSLEI